MTENLNYDERKEWARTLFTKQQYSMSDTASAVNADEASVRYWITEGGREGVKRSFLISKNTQLAHFYDQIDKLNGKISKNPDEINTKEVDLICKYTTAIKNLEVDVTIAQIIEVTELFVKWLKPRDLTFTKQVTARLDAFIREKLAA